MQKQLELLRKYEITVAGIRGQHFLIDPNIQRKIVALVDAKPDDRILEIGPGLGALTDQLLTSGANITVIEKDPRFCNVLRSEFAPVNKNLTVIEGDILSFNLSKIFPKKNPGTKLLKVVGNLPYYITTPIILFLINHRKLIDCAVLMMQKEIIDRMLAQPGTKDYGRLTLLARFYADVTREFDVAPGCFSPKPKVKSSVAKFVFHGKEPNVDETLFFEVVRFAFNERRKNILNAVSHGFREIYPKTAIESALEESGIKSTKRAEELLLKDFLNLTQALESKNLKNGTVI